jgi:hypothetical protein
MVRGVCHMTPQIRAASLATLVVLARSIALADDIDNRAKLMGKWELQKSKNSDAVWIVEDVIKNRDEFIHITRQVGGQTVSDFECNVGLECAIKVSGKSAKVMMYFNGGKLVETETKGNEVVKRRFALSDSPDVLEVEVMPLVPAGNTEKLVFKRVAASAK